MVKRLIQLIFLLLVLSIIFFTYLSIYGISTDNFNNLITQKISERNKNLKSHIELNYKSSEVNNFINEELNKISTNHDKTINKKLLETLYKGIEKRIPILLENKKAAGIFGIKVF